MPDDTEPSWRAVAAALANDRTRLLYARVVLGEADADAGLAPSRRRHAWEALHRAGLVTTAPDGTLTARGEVFADLLRAAPAPSRRGIARFLRPDGRIDRYPTNVAERHDLLAHVAGRVLRPGEVIGERELGGRLAGFADDIAALRRHLVDAGLIERTRSGAEYALPVTEATTRP
ncbi:DUF2087 domain-containing protein [Microbacterium sp.]|uniref:DUF2087 domain-containing protein n=1 Tax=Microbacterium sp. TaxID=51671 RepID=UPI003A8795A2